MGNRRVVIDGDIEGSRCLVAVAVGDGEADRDRGVFLARTGCRVGDRCGQLEAVGPVRLDHQRRRRLAGGRTCGGEGRHTACARRAGAPGDGFRLCQTANRVDDLECAAIDRDRLHTIGAGIEQRTGVAGNGGFVINIVRTASIARSRPGRFVVENRAGRDRDIGNRRVVVDRDTQNTRSLVAVSIGDGIAKQQLRIVLTDKRGTMRNRRIHRKFVGTVSADDQNRSTIGIAAAGRGIGRHAAFAAHAGTPLNRFAGCKTAGLGNHVEALKLDLKSGKTVSPHAEQRTGATRDHLEVSTLVSPTAARIGRREQLLRLVVKPRGTGKPDHRFRRVIIDRDRKRTRCRVIVTIGDRKAEGQCFVLFNERRAVRMGQRRIQREDVGTVGTDHQCRCATLPERIVVACRREGGRAVAGDDTFAPHNSFRLGKALAIHVDNRELGTIDGNRLHAIRTGREQRTRCTRNRLVVRVGVGIVKPGVRARIRRRELALSLVVKNPRRNNLMGNRRVVIDGNSECGRKLVPTGIRRRNGEFEGQRLVGRIGMIEIANQHEIVGSGAVIRQRDFEHLVSLGAAVALVGGQNSAAIRQNILNGNAVGECRLRRLNRSECQRPVAQAGGQILRPADGIGGISIIAKVGTPIDSEVACRCQKSRFGRRAVGQIVFVDGRTRRFTDKRSVVRASYGDRHGLDGRQDAVIDPDFEG